MGKTVRTVGNSHGNARPYERTREKLNDIKEHEDPKDLEDLEDLEKYDYLTYLKLLAQETRR